MIGLKLLQVIVCLLLFCCGVIGQQCKTLTVVEKTSCGENELCEENAANSGIGTCLCKAGFKRSPETSLCVSAEDSVDTGSGGHVVAGILISLLLVVLVIIAFYYNKKYRLISLIRYKLNQRYNSNYDDLMIGQDDD